LRRRHGVGKPKACSSNKRCNAQEEDEIAHAPRARGVGGYIISVFQMSSLPPPCSRPSIFHQCDCLILLAHAHLLQTLVMGRFWTGSCASHVFLVVIILVVRAYILTRWHGGWLGPGVCATDVIYISARNKELLLIC
jgi:hypothetical protein